jgi:hypothetical protein
MFRQNFNVLKNKNNLTLLVSQSISSRKLSFLYLDIKKIYLLAYLSLSLNLIINTISK